MFISLAVQQQHFGLQRQNFYLLYKGKDSERWKWGKSSACVTWWLETFPAKGTKAGHLYLFSLEVLHILKRHDWKGKRCGWDLAERFERLKANAEVATVLGWIPASSGTVASEGRQCWIKYLKIIKNPHEKRTEEYMRGGMKALLSFFPFSTFLDLKIQRGQISKDDRKGFNLSFVHSQLGSRFFLALSRN